MTRVDLVLQAPDLQAATVAACAALVGATGPLPEIRDGRVRLRVPAGPPKRDEQLRVTDLCKAGRVDAAWVPGGRRLADFRVLAMDMDSTLITVECIDEVAALAGKGEAVRAITEAAMRGEIADYSASLARRVALLAGTPDHVLADVWRDKVRLSAGAEALLAACRAGGLRTLLVSGGFTYFTDRLQQRLGLDATWANEIEVEQGRLTGRVSGPGGGPIVDAAGKAAAVQALCARVGCAPSDAIVIGDGANDLAMMAEAGLSIAFHAKPAVRQRADVAIDHGGLDAVLGLFEA
jgi:phosphoserine phosphatase